MKKIFLKNINCECIHFNYDKQELLQFEDDNSENLDIINNKVEIDKQQYYIDLKISTIPSLWKSERKTKIYVINNKNEIFEIYGSSYKKRKIKKSINALKFAKKCNKCEEIKNYNKKI